MMSHDLSFPPDLAGQLLLAVPSMRDPQFSRAVIFLAAHSTEEGAYGYILNRPLKQRVADLMPDQELGPLGEVPVFIGGPVNADKLAFVSMRWMTKHRMVSCESHLSVDDALHELSMGRHVRGFVGYSGWSKGQLEQELQRRSWISSAPQRLILSTRKPSKLWGQLLENMGPIFGLMAKTPENVGLN